MIRSGRRAMTTEDAFILDILEYPDDDTPRLVFADWLDDQGQGDRGELIRLQCSLARLARDDESAGPLKRRVEELLRARWDEWVRPLARLVGTSESWLASGFHPEALWKFQRGFVYMLDVEAP